MRIKLQSKQVITVLLAVSFVACSSAESKKRDLEQAARLAEQKKMHLFVRELCQESSSSPQSAETPEVKLCTRDVKRSFPEYLYKKRFEMAVFICDNSSTLDKWREQAIPRLNCYMRAAQFLKEPSINEDAAKCQGSPSREVMVVRGRGDCYRNIFNDLMSQE